MAKHIYLESSYIGEKYFGEIDKLSGSYIEKIEDKYDKAIITAVNVDLTNANGEKYWCVEIVESNSFPIIKYYHFTFYFNSY
jgi:hypothetical protein